MDKRRSLGDFSASLLALATGRTAKIVRYGVGLVPRESWHALGTCGNENNEATPICVLCDGTRCVILIVCTISDIVFAFHLI